MVNNTIFTKTQHYSEILRHIAAVRKILEDDVKKDSSKKAAMLEILKTYNITFILCLREGIKAYEDADMTCMCIDGDVYTCRKQILLNLISEDEYCSLMALPVPQATEQPKTAEELELELILGESEKKNENLTKSKREVAPKKEPNPVKNKDKTGDTVVSSKPADWDKEKSTHSEIVEHAVEKKTEKKEKKEVIKDAATEKKPDYIPANIKDYVDKSTNYSEKTKTFANKLSIPQSSMICDVYTATVSEVIDKEQALDEKHVFSKIIPDRNYIFYVVPFDIPDTGSKIGADIMVCMIDCTKNEKRAFVTTSDKKTIVVDIGGKREIWISGDWDEYRFESSIHFYDRSDDGIKMEMVTASSHIRSKDRLENNSGHVVYRFARGKLSNGQKRSSIIHAFPIGTDNDANGLTDIVLMEERDVIEDGVLQKHREIHATGMPSPVLLSDESTRVHGFWNAEGDFQIEIV